MERKQFDYTIVKHLGTIATSGDYSKQLTIVRWKNGGAKIDLRMWRNFDDEQNRQPLKGLSLNTDEATALRNLLNESVV